MSTVERQEALSRAAAITAGVSGAVGAVDLFGTAIAFGERDLACFTESTLEVAPGAHETPNPKICEVVNFTNGLGLVLLAVAATAAVYSKVFSENARHLSSIGN